MRPYERLLNYVTYDTASDGNSETCPSTEKQRVFARVLEQEMRSLGLENVRLDGNGYLYGTVPGNIPGYSGTVLGFIAHMDVVNDVPSAGVKARRRHRAQRKRRGALAKRVPGAAALPGQETGGHRRHHPAGRR